MTNDDNDARTADLARGLHTVRTRLAEAVTAAGRPAGDVELLVVTKFFPAADVERLIGLGVREFGESREPEAGRKIHEVRESYTGTEDLAFDMIGSVQSKKVRGIAGWARTVHSVDRDKVADGLGRAAADALDDGRRTDPLGVLLQVSLDGDPQRGGVPVDEVAQLADRVAAVDSLRLGGLMVIAPVEGDAERWMARAAEVRDVFLDGHPDALEFSAGMSGDMAEAIAHGSTCVRVGTAIMGPRPLISH